MFMIRLSLTWDPASARNCPLWLSSSRKNISPFQMPHTRACMRVCSVQAKHRWLKFGSTFSGFHMHPAFAAAANYLFPSASASVVWVGYFWDEARMVLGEEGRRVMKSSDILSLRKAGVKLYTFTQHPGDFVVTHPLIAHMVFFSGKQAGHLACFLDWIPCR